MLSNSDSLSGSVTQHDMRFSQQCWLRFKPSGIRHVDQYIVMAQHPRTLESSGYKDFIESTVI